MLGYKNSYSIQYFYAYIGQRQKFHTVVVTRNTGGPKTSWRFLDLNNFKESSYEVIQMYYQTVKLYGYITFKPIYIYIIFWQKYTC